MSPPLTITGPWLALVSRAGSIAALALALGVPRPTLVHWIRGERRPSEIVQRAVNAWARAHRCPVPFAEAA